MRFLGLVIFLLIDMLIIVPLFGWGAFLLFLAFIILMILISVACRIGKNSRETYLSSGSSYSSSEGGGSESYSGGCSCGCGHGGCGCGHGGGFQ